MFAAAVIVFRESLEAALIISIMLAATRGIDERGKWVTVSYKNPGSITIVAEPGTSPPNNFAVLDQGGGAPCGAVVVDGDGHGLVSYWRLASVSRRFRTHRLCSSIPSSSSRKYSRPGRSGFNVTASANHMNVATQNVKYMR